MDQAFICEVCFILYTLDHMGEPGVCIEACFILFTLDHKGGPGIHM